MWTVRDRTKVLRWEERVYITSTAPVDSERSSKNNEKFVCIKYKAAQQTHNEENVQRSSDDSFPLP